MDILFDIKITHLKDQLVINWPASASVADVTVRAFDNPQRRGEPTSLLAVDQVAASAVFSPPRQERRWYFEICGLDCAPLVVAERALTLEGAVNFRDLGGYQTRAGKRLRWGRVFRSGHLSNLSARDKRVFAGLDIGNICDFRLAEERDKEKTDLPGDAALRILGIQPGIGDKRFFHRLFASANDPSEVVDAMHRMMAVLVIDAAPHYAGMFETLHNAPDKAVLLNCSAGKERTGIGSALFLAALDVPYETILYDFMLSGEYFPALAEVPRVLEKYEVKRPRGEAERLIMPLLETRESYLKAAWDALDAEYGSVDEFLATQYGLDQPARAALQAIYTE